MKLRIASAPAVALLILVLLSTVGAISRTNAAGEVVALHPERGGLASLPCIPTWVRNGDAPAVYAGGPFGAGGARLPHQRVDYQTLIDFAVTSEVFDTYDDQEADNLTLAFTGDYSGDTVVMHTIDALLNHTAIPLPTSYGQSWLAEDLDLDGQLDLVLQRGDPGMGGNGYLDILSAPDWTLRTRIVLAGMKVYFYPVAVNVDEDPHLELYLTPSALSGSARVMVVDYDPDSGNFVLADNLTAPYSTGGPTAAGDFDQDGKVEFITGNSSGYRLFEYEPDGLYDRGPIPGAPNGNNASALRPLPGGELHAVLGHSSFDRGYRYQLMRATGDNTFEIVEIFNEVTGWAGIHPSFGLDADLDGLDEIVMEFHPNSKVFEWDRDLDLFQEIWSWDEAAMGTFIHWKAADCDRDHVPEWCTVDHTNLFRALEDQDVDPGSVDDPPWGAAGLSLRVQPNPLCGPARIAWQGGPGSSEPLAVSIHDVRGRRLCSYGPLQTAPGSGCFSWSGCDESGKPLSPGVYWIRISSSRGEQTQRITIVR